MSSAEYGNKSKTLRILLIPFFDRSHIIPYTDLAVCLAAIGPYDVQPTVAVTPANVTVVREALYRHRASAAGSAVNIATYPFPNVPGLPPGVENLTAAADDAWRIEDAAIDDALSRPAQEALIREQSPDAVITDVHFFWNSIVAGQLGVPCVKFSVVGPFSTLAMYHLCSEIYGDYFNVGEEVTVPGFPAPEIRIPTAELPEFVMHLENKDHFAPYAAAEGRPFGFVFNTFLDMEKPYCELYARHGYEERVYFVGPLSLPSPPPARAPAGDSRCILWLGSMPRCSVVYVSLDTYASISDDQLRELAFGLEASGKPFLWVLRADGWAPPAGWAESVVKRGMLVRGWAPQTDILNHPSVGAFLTHCGSSSVLEAAAAGVPMLTWPMVFDQFIVERLITDVLKVGQRVGSGRRSTRGDEKVTVPVPVVARAVARFLEPGGTGEAARVRARELAVKAHAAVAPGGSSHGDLRRLINDLIEAKEAAIAGGGTVDNSTSS